jgi:hypothetical protein
MRKWRWRSVAISAGATLTINRAASEYSNSGQELPDTALAEHIRNAELHIVQGGRHGYLVEYQWEGSRVVLQFLARYALVL